MIYKHIGIVKEISRVGLPGFQSKDRVEAGLTSLYMNFSSSRLREDERSNSGGRRKKNPKAICAANPNPKKNPGFLYFIYFLFIYIEAFKSVKSKTPNLMRKVKKGWDHDHVCYGSEK
jgi:hypothetical protein